ELEAESDRPARTPYSVDAMLWCVRLAKLEERNSGTRTAEYVREAWSRCQNLGWADCSEQRLRSEVDRMDSIARKAECWRSLSGLPTQKKRRRSVGRLRRLVSGCRPHHGNRQSRTGSDVVITRISCPTQTGAIKMPRTGRHSFRVRGSTFQAT